MLIYYRLSVVDNQYEDSVVQMVGEGYQDDVTIDNIRQIVTFVDPEKEEGNNADDDVSGNLSILILSSKNFVRIVLSQHKWKFWFYGYKLGLWLQVTQHNATTLLYFFYWFFICIWTPWSKIFWKSSASNGMF